MSFIAQPRTGRQLMVLDDAESIARQARRRAVARRRQQESLQIAVGAAIVLGIMALVMGVALQTVLLVAGAVFVAGAALVHRLREAHDQRRRVQVRARVGNGIGTPRPKGGFSTTRHRSGAPVWIDRRAA